jgi:hypothetical protein
LPWRFDLDGVSLREDELTVGECERIEKLTGESWHTIHPLRSATHAAAVVEVVLMRGGESADKCGERARALTMREILDAFQNVDDDLPEQYEDGVPPSGVGT